MMGETPSAQPRLRRSTVAIAILATAALTSIALFARCSGGESVTPEALAGARKTWDDAAIKNYELEWVASGRVTAHYYVTVRDGKVRKIESIAPDGRRFELHPPESRFYGVEGLFTTIADELAQLKEPRPFGQPPGTKVVMRFTRDPKLGYPRSYRRNVLGTSLELAIDVVRLIPEARSGGT
jgi:hypothetical protein